MRRSRWFSDPGGGDFIFVISRLDYSTPPNRTNAAIDASRRGANVNF